jgi:hypothetical protein
LFLNETPDTLAMTDWYFTESAKKRGFSSAGKWWCGRLYSDDIRQAVCRELRQAATKTSLGWASMPKRRGLNGRAGADTKPEMYGATP